MTKKIPLHVVFVEARIRKGDTYLLAKRSSKDDQAAWKRAVPGGKVDMELESDIVENALKREVLEEVGLEIDNFRFLWSRSFIRSSGHHVVGLSFVADHVSGEAIPLDDQDEVKWVTFEEMDILLDDHRGDTVKTLKKQH
jgi:ADP-ribose pyrophosphatase YjhB (NUDIX family)